MASNSLKITKIALCFSLCGTLNNASSPSVSQSISPSSSCIWDLKKQCSVCAVLLDYAWLGLSVFSAKLGWERSLKYGWTLEYGLSNSLYWSHEYLNFFKKRVRLVLADCRISALCYAVSVLRGLNVYTSGMLGKIFWIGFYPILENFYVLGLQFFGLIKINFFGVGKILAFFFYTDRGQRVWLVGNARDIISGCELKTSGVKSGDYANRRYSLAACILTPAIQIDLYKTYSFIWSLIFKKK
ncbi:MAG: hypothetical protein II393_00565 [Cytophagales bacterium]|nr:hypothetical protein [Cytophagales bacterium]